MRDFKTIEIIRQIQKIRSELDETVFPVARFHLWDAIQALESELAEDPRLKEEQKVH